MQQSTNYNMNLPEGYDQFDIAHFNQNTRFLDSKIKSLENVTDTVNSVSKKLTATLNAGSTYVSFQDSSIGNDSLIDVYTNVFGVNPENIQQSGNTVVVSFVARNTPVTITLVVTNWSV